MDIIRKNNTSINTNFSHRVFLFDKIDGIRNQKVKLNVVIVCGEKIRKKLELFYNYYH